MVVVTVIRSVVDTLLSRRAIVSLRSASIIPVGTKIEIYSISVKLIAKAEEGNNGSPYEAIWDLTTLKGNAVKLGVYIIRFNNKEKEMNKVVFITK